MRFLRSVAVLVLSGCGGSSSASNARIDLPRVYPPVRASTPSSLILDPMYQAAAKTSALRVAGLPQALVSPAANLAQTIQERLYTAGPTEILRIVHELDDRTLQLDTTPSKHECLTATPRATTIALPGGQTFTLQLQCIEHWSGGGGWIAFGFDSAQSADAGLIAAHGGNDFYLLEGQTGGMGGAYHLAAGSGNVEGWMSVADSRVPSGSQVLMHLLTDQSAGTTELTLAGSGVGFCAAHLKTSSDYLFIRAKTNGAPPPGTPISAAGQYCDAARSGCFATSALDADLGGDAASCSTLGFDIALDLDASGDASANVTPARVYEYFAQEPTNIADF
jgi:hypothetical protein